MIVHLVVSRVRGDRGAAARARRRRDRQEERRGDCLNSSPTALSGQPPSYPANRVILPTVFRNNYGLSTQNPSQK